MKKALSLLLVVILLATLFTSCSGNEETNKANYLGTWVRRSSTGNIFSCVIFDENGYWEIFMDHSGLSYGISQKPELFTTFEHFIDGNVNSDITYCDFEYHENSDYTKQFRMDDSGNLYPNAGTGDWYYTKYSDHTGYPEDAILKEAKAIFDRAMADSKN